MKGYVRFGAMIATSTLVMFGLMYLNTYQLDHVGFSETRAYMALVMGATMAVIMLSFMLHMYSNPRLNVGVVLGSAIVFSVALWLVRSQVTIEDVSYMRAMIPHHSIAILTSERARISDSRVRALADRIIQTQREEIAEMKMLIKDLENRRWQPAWLALDHAGRCGGRPPGVGWHQACGQGCDRSQFLLRAEAARVRPASALLPMTRSMRRGRMTRL